MASDPYEQDIVQYYQVCNTIDLFLNIVTGESNIKLTSLRVVISHPH